VYNIGGRGVLNGSYPTRIQIKEKEVKEDKVTDPNRWCGMGRLVDDPKLSYTPKGTPLASFKIANSVGFGEFKKTNFIPCKMYGKKAETFVKYTAKGRRVFVEGEVQWLSGKNDDGTYWNYVPIIVDNFAFSDAQNGNGASAGPGSVSPEAQEGPDAVPDNPYGFDQAADDEDEQIPF
jgi:single-strand DNA-binding protein